MPDISPRMKEDVKSQLREEMPFDELFELCLAETERLYLLLKKEKEKKASGRDYSAYRFKKARLLSLNAQDLFKHFRIRSVKWDTARRLARDEERAGQDGLLEE